jgi:hypothetical protein
MRGLIIGGAVLLTFTIAVVVVITLTYNRGGSGNGIESHSRADVTSSPAIEGTTESMSSPRTQAEIKAQLLEVGQKIGSAEFRVRLRAFGGQEVTWYQDGGDRLRLDLKDRGTDGKGRERIFVQDGSAVFSCREPGICARDTTELFDFGSDQEELEALGSVLVNGFLSFGEALVGIDVVYSSEQIADVQGLCFVLAPAVEYEQEVCFDGQGVPLRLAFSYTDAGTVGLRYEAVEVARAVHDSDFEPPYPFEQ